MNYRHRAQQLLSDFQLCLHARPKHNAVDLQLEKDSVAELVEQLNRQLVWGSEIQIVLACQELEPRLKKLQEKLIIEIIQNGTV